MGAGQTDARPPLTTAAAVWASRDERAEPSADPWSQPLVPTFDWADAVPPSTEHKPKQEEDGGLRGMMSRGAFFILFGCV